MARTRSAPRPLAELVTDLMTPACRKRGVANTALLMCPVDLFGERFAPAASVERIIWPRGSRIDDDDSTGATLVVRADARIALTLQHAASQIVERANLIIGWPAIAHLRVTQVRGFERKQARITPSTPAPTDSAALARHESDLSGFTHQNLKSALARLAAGVERRGLTGGRKTP